MNTSLAVIPIERIQKHILLLRGQKVMLSQHLAELYDVPVKVLNQAVRRNRERFPEDFMFQLDHAELENLKSQIVTSSWGGARSLPYAFTEQESQNMGADAFAEVSLDDIIEFQKQDSYLAGKVCCYGRASIVGSGDHRG